MIQNSIVFILGLTILITAMLIIIVMFLGVLRVALMSVFEWDYVKAIKERKKIRKDKEESKFRELHKDKQLGYYIAKENE